MSDIDRLKYLSNQLHQGAQKFANAAQALRQQAQSLDWSTQDLASGVDAWAGAGSRSFTAAWNRYHNSTQKSATSLDNTSQALSKLAQRIDDSVQQMRTAQAMQTASTFLTVGLVVLDVVQLGLDPVTDAATVGMAGADVAVAEGADAAATAIVEADAEIASTLDEIEAGIENTTDAGDIPIDGGSEPSDITFDDGGDEEPPSTGGSGNDGGNGGDCGNGDGNSGIDDGDDSGDGGSSDNGGSSSPNKEDGNKSSNAGSGGNNNLPATTEESVTKKLSDYLLNPDHPVGRSKANWFKSALGFTRDNADKLAKQIVFDPSTAVETGVTPYGTKFNQVISIVGENGKTIDVVFAWIRNNDGIVRLVTAIPTK